MAEGGPSAPVTIGAMFGKELAPIREKLRVIVLTDVMGLQSGPDVDSHAIRILTLRRWCTGRSRTRRGLRRQERRDAGEGKQGD